MTASSPSGRRNKGNVMSATYERILREAQDLRPEERARLRDELDTPGHPQPSGAALAAFVDTLGPLDREVGDEMKSIIVEQFEQIDVRD
jgi:hypothetical protein